MLQRIQGYNPAWATSRSPGFFREVMSACLRWNNPWALPSSAAPTFSESRRHQAFRPCRPASAADPIDDVFAKSNPPTPITPWCRWENSTEGAVGRTMDLLLSTPLKICGEVVLRIHQNLLTRADGLEKITKVYSTPSRFPSATNGSTAATFPTPRISVGSNAQAAQKAAEEEGAAAIAGEAAAARYDLPKLAENIGDEPNNTTRFLVPSGATMPALGQGTRPRSSCPRPTAPAPCFCWNPLPAPASMTCLESSRPGTPLGIRFYVDIDGHREDAAVKAALDEPGQAGGASKVLGSYPLAVYWRNLNEFVNQALSYVCAISPYQPGKLITELAGKWACRWKRSSSWFPTRTRWA